LCALAAVTSSSSSELAWLEAAARAATVGLPIAAGLYAIGHSAFARFGRLLIVAGAGSFLMSLSGSSDARLYSLGRVSGWLVEVWLIYLILAFPAGRLSWRVDRALAWGAGVLVASGRP
jgi:hypothetical protein